MPSMKKNALRYVVSAAVSLVAVYAVVMSSGCSSSSEDTPPPPPPPPPATKTIYTGTIYLASTGGGHIAVVPVTIDPSNATTPIALGTLNYIQLKTSDGTEAGKGTANTTHNFHDVRLDGNKLYYSAIKVDSTTGSADLNKVHLGYVDLANGNAVNDAVLDATTAAQGSMVYCGSGQTTTHLFPMTMSSPAYIDAIPKSDVVNGADLSSSSTGTVKRTFIEDFRTNPNYVFAHGINSPDGTKLFVALNESSAPGSGMTGAISAYLLDASDLAAGITPDVAGSTTISGLATGGTTVAFRSTYTSDGKILQAGKDRLLVLSASDLTVLDNNTAIGGSYMANTGLENHDVMPTSDGKYAILALRFKYTSTGKQDSGIQLYDLANKKTIGEPVSTCNRCHSPSNPSGVGTDRATCGLDGKLTASTVNQ
jgi:hypothetical protein